jgi:ferredoxin
MKITIDRAGCIECGVCQVTCPDIFEMEDSGAASISIKYRREENPGAGQVDADLAPCAQEAADSCPVSVIGVE